MRFTVTIISTIVLGVVLFKSGVIDALMMFVIVGAIPSTSHSFSASTMLSLVLATAWLALIQLSLLIIRLSRKSLPNYLSNYQVSPALKRKSVKRQRRTV